MSFLTQDKPQPVEEPAAEIASGAKVSFSSRGVNGYSFAAFSW